MSTALSGVDDVLAFIDRRLEVEASEDLEAIRVALVDRPEWSEVVESNMRAQVARARRELAHHEVQSDLAAELFMSAIRNVSGQRDRARGLAVELEQELAETRAKLDRWLSGERAL